MKPRPRRSVTRRGLPSDADLAFIVRRKLLYRRHEKHQSADPVVEAIFASLQWAWAHNHRRHEEETWARLMKRLLELPPPPDLWGPPAR
jgi:hypothetical protein